MENASKALLMAAGVLMGIMILSLAIYLFASLASYAEGVEESNRENQTAQFNSQFLSYNEMTLYDVITVANLARNYNEINGFTQSDEEYITVSVYLKGQTQDSDTYTNANFETSNGVGRFNIESYPSLVGYNTIDSENNQTYILCKYKYSETRTSENSQRVNYLYITKAD